MKIAKLILPGCTAILVGLFLCNAAALPQNPANRTPSYKIGVPDMAWVERTLKSLSLREKIAQLIQVRVTGKFINRQSAEFKTLREQIRQLNLGGVVLFSGNVYESAILLNEFQIASKLPLLVSADFERGVSFRISDTTSFPWTMAIGATGSEQFAYQQGIITAQESRAVGVHWIFAPVMDVNNNPDNPVINIRSFGEDPQLVARLGAAFIRGARSAGVLTTAKHFPGHGDTATDSHIGLPVVESNLARLQSLEFVPFKSAIEAGVDSIMTAHVAVPQVTGEAGTPATLSSQILTDLLQDQLKFNGLVVTDALEMGGITSHYWSGLAATRALQAGADILLLPLHAVIAINEIERAVKRGDISVNRINKSVKKVLQAKSSLGLVRSRTVPINRIGELVTSPQNTRVAQEIADRSITVVKDELHLLPVNPRDDPRVFSLVLASDLETSPGSVFQSAMRRLYPSVRTVGGSLRISAELSASIEKSAAESDLIVCSTLARLSSGQEKIAIPEDQQEIIQKLLALRKPMIWISFGNPYVLRLAPQIGTYICAFSYADVSQTAAAKALAGEIAITGKMPISIPGYSRIGEGLQFPKLEMLLKQAPPEETDFSQNTFEETRQLIASFVKDKLFPGAGIIVGHKDSVVLKYAAGRQGYAPDAREAGLETIYYIASLSDIVGTLSAAMLSVESGNLKLDASVEDYLPEIHGQDGKMRVQDLLGALSINDKVNDDDIKYKISSIKEIISRASGLPIDRFLTARLFAPLGMKATSFGSQRPFPKLTSPAEVKNHTGLFCSVSDLAVFAQMLLNRGIYDHKRYVSPGTLARFTGSGSLSQGTHALGWSKPSSDWTGRLFSSIAYGYRDSSGSFLWIDPEKQLFIVLLTNGERPSKGNGMIGEAQKLISESIVTAIANR